MRRVPGPWRRPRRPRPPGSWRLSWPRPGTGTAPPPCSRTWRLHTKMKKISLTKTKNAENCLQFSVGVITMASVYSRRLPTLLNWGSYITVDSGTTAHQNGAFPNKCTIKHPFHRTATWKVWKFMKTTSLCPVWRKTTFWHYYINSEPCSSWLYYLV